MFFSKVSRQSLVLSLLLYLTAITGGAAHAESPAAAPIAIPIGAEDDWYPYSALRDGKPKGFTVDLVTAIFAATKTPLKLVPVPYTRCMDDTRTANLAGCFDTLRNPLLESEYLWHSEPLFKARIVIYGSIKETSNTLDINALEGKTVAVTNGYDYGKAFDSSKTIKKSPGPMDINGLRKLAEGKVDYSVIYDKNAEILLADNPELQNKIKVVGTLIEPDIYLSFSKTYPDIQNIIKKFDEGFAILKANGEYDRIRSQWGITMSLTEQVWRITSLEWPPYAGKNLPEGGSAIKALRNALKTEGVKLEVDYFPWTRALDQARNTDKYIGVFPCWPEDAERYAKDFDMFKAIGRSPVGIAEHRSNPMTIKSMNDLIGKKIGIVLSYGNSREFNELADKGKILTKTSPTDLDGLRALNAQNTDGMFIDINVMNYLLTLNLPEAKKNIVINTGWTENKKLLLATPANHPQKINIKTTYEKALNNIDTAGIIEAANKDLLAETPLR